MVISADIRSRAIENQTKFILTDEDRAPRILEAVRDLDFVKEVFVIGKFDGCTPAQVLFEDDGQSNSSFIKYILKFSFPEYIDPIYSHDLMNQVVLTMPTLTWGH